MFNIWFVKILFYVMISTVLGGCFQGTDASDGVVIPKISFECDEFQVPKCTPSESLSKIAYLGLILSEIDCYNYLEGIPSGHFHQFFDASSATLVDSYDSIATGTFTNYKSNGGATLLLLKSGIYHACGFIDINSNKKVDFFEPVSTTTIDIGDTYTREITDWTQF